MKVKYLEIDEGVSVFVVGDILWIKCMVLV